MKPDNPAVYECKGIGSEGIHHWERLIDGTAICIGCKTVLTARHASEAFGQPGPVTPAVDSAIRSVLSRHHRR